MGHAREVGDERRAGDVAPERQRETGVGGLVDLALDHLAKKDLLARRVGDLDADDGLGGDRRQDADAERAERHREVVGQRDDAPDLDAGGRLELVHRDDRPGLHRDDFALDAEIRELVLQDERVRLERLLVDLDGAAFGRVEQIDRGQPVARGVQLGKIELLFGRRGLLPGFFRRLLPAGALFLEHDRRRHVFALRFLFVLAFFPPRAPAFFEPPESGGGPFVEPGEILPPALAEGKERILAYRRDGEEESRQHDDVGADAAEERRQELRLQLADEAAGLAAGVDRERQAEQRGRAPDEQQAAAALGRADLLERVANQTVGHAEKKQRQQVGREAEDRQQEVGGVGAGGAAPVERRREAAGRSVERAVARAERGEAQREQQADDQQRHGQDLPVDLRFLFFLRHRRFTSP